MRWSLVIGAATMALGLAAGAKAAPLPDGGVTAREMADVLQNRGYRAEITTDSDGDPMIKSTAEAINFQVYFYNCNGKPRCKTIQFGSAFDLEHGMELGKINDWNRHNRFGRAYLDDENDPFVEMDVDVEHGFSTEALSNNLDTWVAVLPKFRNFINK